MQLADTLASVNESKAYAQLGLAPGASRADIIRAYRQLARRLHPDVAADPAAAARFAALAQAYQQLLSSAPQPAGHGSAIPVRRVRSAPRPPLVAGPVHVAPAPGQRQGGDDG